MMSSSDITAEVTKQLSAFFDGDTAALDGDLLAEYRRQQEAKGVWPCSSDSSSSSCSSSTVGLPAPTTWTLTTPTTDVVAVPAAWTTTAAAVKPSTTVVADAEPTTQQDFALLVAAQNVHRLQQEVEQLREEYMCRIVALDVALRHAAKLLAKPIG